MYWVSMAWAMQNLVICTGGSPAADPLRDRGKVYQFASDRAGGDHRPSRSGSRPGVAEQELFRLGK